MAKEDAEHEELVELVTEAAITLLHREISRHGKVVLTPADFSTAMLARESEKTIHLSTDGDNVIFTHTKVTGSAD